MDTDAFGSTGRRAPDEGEQLVGAGVDAAVGEEADEVEGVVSKGFRDVPVVSERERARAGRGRDEKKGG